MEQSCDGFVVPLGSRSPVEKSRPRTARNAQGRLLYPPQFVRPLPSFHSHPMPAPNASPSATLGRSKPSISAVHWLLRECRPDMAAPRLRLLRSLFQAVLIPP